MESIGILWFGLAMGMRHALEADHVAAVATLTSAETSPRRAVYQGMAWGLGHSLTLLLFGGAVLYLERLVPDRVASLLEAGVGLMLIGLGLDVVRQLLRRRIHFHRHRHGGGIEHFHAHSHAGDPGRHDPRHHHHVHPRHFPLRALLVGSMHGMAGSAALILLALDSVDSRWSGLGYIALFGLGSILGMAALSLAIAVPLRMSAQRFTWLHHAVQGLAGTAALALGLVLLIDFARGQLPASL